MMKKFLFFALLLTALTAGAQTAKRSTVQQSQPSSGEVVEYDGMEYIRVATAEQFVNALGSVRGILVAKDTEINLTPVLNDSKYWEDWRSREWKPESMEALVDSENEMVVSEQAEDGFQLTLINLKQLLIRGEGNSRLVVESRYAFCLRFVNCQQVEVRNLTIGHTVGGNCLGGVIGVTGGWRVSIRDCDLYGCGAYGLAAEDTRDFSMYNSNIRDCTSGIMRLRDVDFAKFQSCDFFRNRQYTLVESRGSAVTFYDCRFYDNNPTSPLFKFDQEFFLSACVIFHPTAQLGTIDLADQSGEKNWWSPDPKDTGIKPRGIGPDQKQ